MNKMKNALNRLSRLALVGVTLLAVAAFPLPAEAGATPFPKDTGLNVAEQTSIEEASNAGLHPGIEFNSTGQTGIDLGTGFSNPTNDNPDYQHLSTPRLDTSTHEFDTPTNDDTNSTDVDDKTKLYRIDSTVVTAGRNPLSMGESARVVTVIEAKAIQSAPVQSVNDILKYAPGVDVRQRGAMGVQTDITIRGGSFDQITLLLNGVNISNPQTGHLAADFPVAMEDIERIEILEGPASRVYGTSAFTGAINIITKADSEKNIRVDATGGSYGLGGGGVSANLSGGAWTSQLSGGYLRSDGGTENSDFSRWRAYYQGGYDSEAAEVKLQAGGSWQEFGANTFYSAKYPNQFEETARYLISLQAETKKGWLRFHPTAYWNRSVDHYQLIRGSSTGENFHRTDVYGLNLNASFTTAAGRTSLGMEVRNEGILSTTLGRPLDEDQYVDVPGHSGHQYTNKDNRTDISYYLEQALLLPKATFSVGVLADMNTAYDSKFHFYPGVDVSYRPSVNWKILASWNMALRMPTFTDLYYQSPTTEGNVGLHPEETMSLDFGAEYRRPALKASASFFWLKGKNMIDWVMYSEDDIYHSANFKLDNLGAEINAYLVPRERLGEDFFIESFNIGYAYIHQERHDDTEVYKASYALEYLRHKLVVGLTHRIWRQLQATWSLRWQDRMGSYIRYENADDTGTLVSYSPYSVLDLRIQWNGSRYKIYIEGNNLTDCTYYDHGNVPQPGLWVKAGASLTFGL